MSQSLELASPEPQAVALRSDPEAILRYAIDKGADVSVIERMMVIRRELRDEQAKAAFDAAMAAFQTECPVVTKAKGVPDRSGSVAYKYAPFEDIIAQVKPALQKHGFSYTLDTDTESQAGWVVAKCHVTHSAGHSRTSTAKFPLGTKTGIMSDTQVYAAALTFASRRVFCNAFGIVTAGEDSDGRVAKAKPQGPSSMVPDNQQVKDLARQLWTLLESVRGEAKNWDKANEWLWAHEILDGANPDDCMPHLPAERIKLVIAKAKEVLNAH